MSSVDPVMRPFMLACSIAAVMLSSAALLALEMLSMRAAQVAFGIDYKHIIIPLAFLGIGLGAAWIVRLEGTRISHGGLAWLAASMACVSPIPFIIVRWAPGSGPEAIVLLEAAFLVAALVLFTLAGALFAGTFRLFHQNVSLLYGADLVGAASGVVLASVSLDAIGYEYTLALTVCTIWSSAILFALVSMRVRLTVAFVFMLVSVAVLFTGPLSADRIFPIACDPAAMHHASNSFAHIDVVDIGADRLQGVLHEFGDTPVSIGRHASVRQLGIDCFWIFTFIIGYSDSRDVPFMETALRSVPFDAKARSGSLETVLVPGSGGGIDAQRALLYGARTVTAVEINPLTLDIVRTFAYPPSDPYRDDRVRVVRDDARVFLEGDTSRYDLIISAKSGRYGAVGADVDFVSYDETVEAFASYIAHLDDDGIFVFTSLPRLIDRRNVAMAAAALDSLGINTHERLMLIRGREGKEDMLIVSREPLSAALRDALVIQAEQRGFSDIRMLDEDAIGDFRASARYMTDESPVPARGTYELYGISLTAGQILASSCALFALVALMMVRFSKRTFLAVGLPRGSWPLALLFVSSSSAGFIMLELVSIQKLFFLVGNPTYTVGTVLFGVLCFAGVGSMFTHLSVSKTRAMHIAGAGAIASLVLFVIFVDDVSRMMLHRPLFARVIVGGALLTPASFFAGMFFPLGLRVVREASPRLIAWAWSVSGVAGIIGGFVLKQVLGSYGFSGSFLLLMSAYLVAWIAGTHLVSGSARPADEHRHGSSGARDSS